MNIYKNMPSKECLINRASFPSFPDFVKVNAHLHTPYSFSAFTDVKQALDLAVSEDVKVLGINDFYSTFGYAEWATGCLERKLFPLFNIEVISLNGEDQQKGVRVNDPNNPGRTYLSGKGLAFPSILKDPYLSKLNALRNESNHHVERMCNKLNDLLQTCSAPFTLSYTEVFETFTRGSVRERHLAKVLRMKVAESFNTNELQLAFYEKLFGGKQLKSDLSDHPGVENEIRGNLLKSGGAAFVSESAAAFPDQELARQIILNAGGIPTYPFLADDAKGNFTDFEQDKVEVFKTLKKRGFASVEFITTRNTIKVLEEYAEYGWNNGFVVTFGTEHNTPLMEPITPYATKGANLSPILMEINYKGAAIIAAHQYLIGTGDKGYINENGEPDLENRDYYIKLGHAVIRQVIDSSSSI